MLGDSAEKSMNPLQRALRRRNAKTVQFSAPTYYEPSDYEYSDEEDIEDGTMYHSEHDSHRDDVDGQQEQRNGVSHDLEDATRHINADATTDNVGANERPSSDEHILSVEPSSPVKLHTLDPGTGLADESGAQLRKTSGRHTDSFLQDDNQETKKISLTPRLLRGDSDSTVSAEQELQKRPSLENSDRTVGQDEKPKDDKKKKEKKGVFGFLKRKDKAAKSSRAEGDDGGRPSDELLRSSQKSSPENVLHRPEAASPERRPSKLQKQPPSHLTKVSPQSETKPSAWDSRTTSTRPQSPPSSLQQKSSNAPSIGLEAQRIRHYTPGIQSGQPGPTLGSPFPSKSDTRSLAAQISSGNPALYPAFSDEPMQQSTHDQHLAAAASTSGDVRGSMDQLLDDRRRHPPDSASPIAESSVEPLRSDSAIQIAPVEALRNNGIFGNDSTSGLAISTGPKALALRHDASLSEVVNDVMPSEADQTASTYKRSPSTATHSPSTSRSTPTWSDASLRMYMENSQDIKDLLIIVHDRSNVMPVGPDHPLMSNLFVKERSRVNEMQTQLDDMLMSWMSKKNPAAYS